MSKFQQVKGRAGTRSVSKLPVIFCHLSDWAMLCYVTVPLVLLLPHANPGEVLERPHPSILKASKERRVYALAAWQTEI